MMRGVLTAPIIGTLLWAIMSMSAISAASIKVCISDSDCGPDNFCSNEGNPSSCAPCLDCQQLLSRVNTGNCSRESQDCGPCVPGFVSLDDDDESCVEGGEWYSQEANETGNSTTEETPSEIPVDHDDDVSSIIWIVLGILAAAVLCILMAGLAKRKRSQSQQDDQVVPRIKRRRSLPVNSTLNSPSPSADAPRLPDSVAPTPSRRRHSNEDPTQNSNSRDTDSHLPEESIPLVDLSNQPEQENNLVHEQEQQTNIYMPNVVVPPLLAAVLQDDPQNHHSGNQVGSVDTLYMQDSIVDLGTLQD